MSVGSYLLFRVHPDNMNFLESGGMCHILDKAPRGYH